MLPELACWPCVPLFR